MPAANGNEGVLPGTGYWLLATRLLAIGYLNLGTDRTSPRFLSSAFSLPASQPAENMSKFLPLNLPIIYPFRRILIP